MFSQLRQAVESLAPQPLRGSVDAPESDSQGARPPSSLSSTQLTDSALSNLRKSLASQRSGSPLPRSPGPPSLPRITGSPDSEPRLPKSNIEERLRAKFAIGEASNVTTPDISGRASPIYVDLPQQQHPLSPSSVPLPQSPIQPEVVVQPVNPTVIDRSQFETLAPSKTVDASSLVKREDGRYPEADVPLPSDSPPATPSVDLYPISTPLHDSPAEPDVQVLQHRLKLVEQRFAGMCLPCIRMKIVF